ncbi:1-deoxy-D-xylulose-5-phosphate synthase [bacterium]|nr:1-deoxy-D-xylulose-5-phosphate synthase [bacterium]
MTSILERIESPQDLRDLTREQLEVLAEEIRQEITRVVTQNGGHLASNLGCVELTLALHRCFDFRNDALVWDVGHQAYVHKLLTGRRDTFPTLRLQGGMSGFPNTKESPYDLFSVGHAGTSISSALGLVCADAVVGRRRRVVAVIGDGSLTSGLALEALNQAGALGRDLLVILNDNKMSINRTVGGLSRHLDRLRSARFYNQAKSEIRRFVRSLPGVGDMVGSALGHIKEGLKATLLPETLFDQLGLRTFGPVDGHDLADLLEHLEQVRDLPGPVLLHVVTEKGRGHHEAAGDPVSFHGVSPTACPIEPGTSEKPSGPTYTSVFASCLCRLGERDERIVAVTAAMEAGTGLAEFGRRYPDRFFDVGICEQHAVTFSGGLSAAGARPVVGIYSTFLQRGYDQVFHDVCLQGSDVVLCLDRAGLVGADGPTHHGVFDIAYLRHLPGIILAAPKDGPELEAMLAAAVARGGPWAVRFPRGSVPADPLSDPSPIEVGRAEVLREGEDGAIVAYGSMVEPAIAAAQLLANDGLQVTVVNARFAKPVDVDLLAELADRVAVMVTVEEHSLAGGFGSAVLEALAGRGGSRSPVACMGVPDRFVEHGARGALLDELGLTPAGIAERVRRARVEALGATQGAEVS